VSNVDGHELAACLKRLQARSTVFLIASKTFTTVETMTNAHSARRWFEAEGGAGLDIGRHFIGLTTNLAAAGAFGIRTTFGFWDWVGGRYSVWSAIGLPLAIAIGAAGFRDFLAGAHAMDQHFRRAPLAENLPVRLGLLDVWYRNFLGFTSRSIAPYHSALRRFPAYLQQLEMESNGKRVDLAGQPLPYGTSPVLWGEPGTNGQHAYFQMLHQGTDVVPVEFIAGASTVLTSGAWSWARCWPRTSSRAWPAVTRTVWTGPARACCGASARFSSRNGRFPAWNGRYSL
jgi:glucose-6-phosphate isomerase